MRRTGSGNAYVDVMDSRVVDKERQVVWSQLKHVGFETRTARTAWRHWHDRVGVVNFQSFSAHNASVLGCTTYSFAIKDRWFVAPDGSNLSVTVADAAGVIHESLGWFEPLRNPEEVRRMLTDDERTSRTSGFGVPGSAR
jgi:hypothetical protein